MKKQQLFNSFWLASTVAVLATKPAWADAVQVTAVRLNPTDSGIQVILQIPKSTSPQVFTSSNGETFVADIINTQLRTPQGDTFRASNPTDSITDVTVTPLNAKSIRVTVTGKAGVPVGKIIQSDRGIVLSLTATDTSLTQAQSRPPKSDQQTTSTTSGPKSQDAVEPAGRSKPASDNRNLEVAQSASPTPTPPAKPSPTVSDIRTQETPPPSYLNPNPNPLQFPTQPEDVRIQGLQPITLQQALDLARRNNRDLQVAQLTLENSRAALRESQANLYPTLDASLGITNRGNNVFSSQGISAGDGTGTPTQIPTGTIPVTSTGTIPVTSTGTSTGTLTGATTATTTGTTPVTSTGTSTGATTATTTGTTPVTSTGATTATTTGTTPVTSSGQAIVPTTGTQRQAITPTTGTSPGTTPGTTTGTSPGTTPGTTTGTSPGTNRQIDDVGSSVTSLLGTLTLRYDLYTSGSRRATIRRAEEQLRFYELDVERQAEQLRLDVSTDYYDLQQADEQVRINQSAVRNAQASLRDAQALEQAGVGTRFDVLRSQVQLANNTQNLTNALRQQQVARRQLAQRLSLAQSFNITAADPVEIAGLWNLSLEESIVLAFQNRAELEQFLAQRNISEQSRRIALANLGPQVGLTASYGAGYNSLFTDVFDRENGIFGDDYSLGANVTLRLFDGGAARARAAQEEANIAIAETRFANEGNAIRFQVEQGYATLQSSFANIQTSTVALEQAREALRLARLRFQAGVGTQTDVIAAENDLTDSEGNRVNAILDYNRSLATLQRAISSGQPR